jgi:hypothetical protein
VLRPSAGPGRSEFIRGVRRTLGRIREAMTRYRLVEIMSGSDAGLWVTLGFSSRMNRDDVLHIVTSSQPKAHGAKHAELLYVERFDQLYSCAEGAELVRVRPRSVEVHLSREAKRALAFGSGRWRFEVPPRLMGYRRAVRTFQAMSQVSQRVVVERLVAGRIAKRRRRSG